MKALDVDLFINAVNAEVAEHPYERLPFTFAALSMDAWAARLDCSKQSVARSFDKPRFHCERVQLAGIQTRIVRVRAPGEPILFSYATVANEMRGPWLGREVDHEAMAKAAAASKPWNTFGMIKDGKTVMTPKQHWLLVRLASAWPNGYQIAILKCVLADWTGFMVRAKAALTLAQDLRTGNTKLEVEGLRYLAHPSLRHMLRFPIAAMDLYSDAEQDAYSERATRAMEIQLGPRSGWNA